jgi:hypothetical protein
MKMRGVVGFANNDFPSFVGFNELTIRVLTEETQEFCGQSGLVLVPPSRHKHCARFIPPSFGTILRAA